MPAQILIADEDGIARDIMAQVLSDRGHAVTVAADGVGALAWLRRGGFDLAVLDYHLPLIDGATAARRVARDGGAAGGTRFVGVTADPDGLEVRDREGIVFDAIVQKPLNLAAFVETVEQCLSDLRRAADPARDPRRLEPLRLRAAPARALRRRARPRLDAAARPRLRPVAPRQPGRRSGHRGGAHRRTRRAAHRGQPVHAADGGRRGALGTAGRCRLRRRRPEPAGTRSPRWRAASRPGARSSRRASSRPRACPTSCSPISSSRAGTSCRSTSTPTSGRPSYPGFFPIRRVRDVAEKLVHLGMLTRESLDDDRIFAPPRFTLTGSAVACLTGAPAVEAAPRRRYL